MKENREKLIVVRKRLLTALILNLIIFTGLAQKRKSFEGKIVFETHSSFDSIFNKGESQLTEVYIKNGKTRSENFSPQGKISVTIMDNINNTSINLIEKDGKKWAIKSTTFSNETNMNDVKVVLSKETKKIAGYVCERVELINKTENSSPGFIVYFTRDFAPQEFEIFHSAMLKEIDGLILEIQMPFFNMISSAKTISIEKIPNEKFTIPKGYKEISEEEYKKLKK